MTAATQTMPGEVRGEGQQHVIERCDELDAPSTEAKHTNLSAATPDSTISVVDAGLRTSLNWEKSVSLWLSSVIDYFGQHLMSYIAGVSEKMDKLEYY